MNKTDHFLEQNSLAIALKTDETPSALHIAFSNPMLADALEKAIQTLEKSHQDLDCHLYAADAEAILESFQSGEIDIAFLPGSVNINACSDCISKEISIRCGSLLFGQIHLPLEPLNQDHIRQKVLWKKENLHGIGEEFTCCLRS